MFASKLLARRLPLWPYFFFGVVALLFGATFIINWWPEDYPEQSDLVTFSGDVASINVRDDISDTPAGSLLPTLTSVYFTLEGVDGEFRYPSSHPQYPRVRKFTSNALDLWVAQDEVGSGNAMTIWQIQEHNPYNEAYQEETFVSYDEIVERLTQSAGAMVRLGSWLLIGSVLLLFAGMVIRRRNQSFDPS